MIQKIHTSLNLSFCSLSDFLYKNSIFHALDMDRIEKETREVQAMPRQDKAKFAMRAGLYNILPSLAVSIIVASGIEYFFEDPSEISLSLPDWNFVDMCFFSVVVAPIAEELLLRLAPHSIMNLVQEKIKYSASTHISNKKVFKFLTGPSTRIALGALFFALPHYGNIGTYTSTTRTVGLIASLLLYPVGSIVYETTGSVSYSILFHMTHNVTMISLMAISYFAAYQMMET